VAVFKLKEALSAWK